jgi:hypothetical protein
MMRPTWPLPPDEPVSDLVTFCGLFVGIVLLAAWFAHPSAVLWFLAAAVLAAVAVQLNRGAGA